jgi:hypothetical protein
MTKTTGEQATVGFSGVFFERNVISEGQFKWMLITLQSQLAAQGKKVRVGLEASGHAHWFERLLGELNFELGTGRCFFS